MSYQSFCVSVYEEIDMKRIIKRGYLLIAGLIMMLVGSYIAITTLDYVTVMSAEDIVPSNNMLSDLRGMGGMLLVLGAYVLIGSFRINWQQPALIIAVGFFTSFVVFRNLGFVLDGWPDTSIMIAYWVEVVMAASGVWIATEKRGQSLKANL